MRYRDGIIATAAALALSLMTLTGVAFSGEFLLAAQAESVGFDALAHEMFDGFDATNTVCMNDATESVQQ